MLQKSKFYYFTILLLVFSLVSCNSTPDKPWTDALSSKTLGLMIYEDNTTFRTVLESDYIKILDDISTAAIPLMEIIENHDPTKIGVKAMALFPSESDNWHPVWIANIRSTFFSTLIKSLAHPFFESTYLFDGITIHKLTIGKRLLFTTKLEDLMLISESSYALESSIRSYLGEEDHLDVTEKELKPDYFYLNLNQLNVFLSQVIAVRYKPFLLNSFKEAGIAEISFKNSNEGEKSDLVLSIVGQSTIDPETPKHSAITNGLSNINSKITLDRYISGDAAAFSVLFGKTPFSPDEYALNSSLDSLLTHDPLVFDQLYSFLDEEFAAVTYAPSGYSDIGEHLFIRRLADVKGFLTTFQKLANNGYVRSINRSYYVSSPIIAKLIGSTGCDYESFYLTITAEAVVISPRLGLSERISADRSRRRVIYYNRTYSETRKRFPDEVSSFIWVESTPFKSYLNAYLAPDKNITAILNEFEIGVVATRYYKTTKKLSILAETFKTEKTKLPYEEQWISPLDGSKIVAQPTLADIGGSTLNEVLVATENGNVFGIANDGTTLFQASTKGEKPTGSPIVYDWYGNNQTAIMVAAGNKIFAWNINGTLLPQFPFELQEEITSPLLVTDITRSGIPEAVVATIDRKIHVLDGRGTNIKGFPVTTNTVVDNEILYLNFNNEWSLIAAADNGLFGWDKNGRLLSGFPVYISSTITAAPSVYSNNLLFGAKDGHIYTLGNNRIFADSLNVLRNSPLDTLTKTLRVGGLYVSDSPIISQPYIEKVRIQTDSLKIYNENMIISLNSDGALFMNSLSGLLRFAKSMGQPAADKHNPIITNLDGYDSREIVTVANFGRLYAWQTFNGERYFTIPTTSVQHPLITDLSGNGNSELIAQTNRGLRCWTFYK